MKELFAQSLSNELADSDRLASAVPGQVGAKNILFSNFWAQLRAIFGVNNWSAREYKSSPCIVVYNKLQYILDESVAPLPYTSTDFATELAANKWLPLGGSGGGGHTIKDSTTTLTQRAGLKFIGNVAVTDDSGGDNTVVEILDDTINPISFSVMGGVNEIPFYPKNAQTFNSVTKDATITDLRVGKNGATPATITFPYSVLVTDRLVFSLTYDQNLNVAFILR